MNEPTMEGFVTKRGHFVKNWKVRWMVLRKSEITYYKDQAKTFFKRKFNLKEDTIIEDYPDIEQQKNIILLNFKHDEDLIISFDSPQTKNTWLNALRDEINALIQKVTIDSIKTNNETAAPDLLVPEKQQQIITNRNLKPKGKVKRLQSQKQAARTISHDTGTNNYKFDKFEFKDNSNISNNSNMKKISKDDMDLLPRLTEIMSDLSEVDNKMGKNDTIVEEEDIMKNNDSNTKSEINEQLADGWKEAYTEDGKLYYYHKVSRITRWDKPEKHIIEASEQRFREYEQIKEFNLEQRKIDQQKKKDQEDERERVIAQQKSIIEKTITDWRQGKNGIDLTFPELLSKLTLILPDDLLLVIYSSSHKIILDSLSELHSRSNPTEVKRMYMKVVRFIHPDKLPSTIKIESSLMTERIFIFLTEKFDLYRKAHELS